MDSFGQTFVVKRCLETVFSPSRRKNAFFPDENNYNFGRSSVHSYRVCLQRPLPTTALDRSSLVFFMHFRWSIEFSNVVALFLAMNYPWWNGPWIGLIKPYEGYDKSWVLPSLRTKSKDSDLNKSTCHVRRYEKDHKD